MAKDDRKSIAPLSVGPVSMSPETDVVDASWDDDESLELEILPPEDSLAPAAPEDHDAGDRATPFLGDELALESGFHERESPTAPLDYLSPPRVPVFDPRQLPDRFAPQSNTLETDPPEIDLPPLKPFVHAARRAPSAELDDPLAHLESDLDSDTPSGDHVPIQDRVTPVQDTPDGLLELELQAPTDRPAGEDPAARDMKERYAVGDFTGALIIAESILETEPEDLDARRYAQSCRDVLMQMYAARLGAPTQIVCIAIPSDQIRWLSLDHRAGFLLSLVDGASSVEELLDICGMPRLDALRILYQLLEQRVIALESG